MALESEAARVPEVPERDGLVVARAVNTFT
jgi:hypothetical protein